MYKRNLVRRLVMKKIISILLSAIILLTTGTAYATETKSADISYNTLPVEFSDNLGTTENLDAMVDDGHLYVNAKQLGERLGYQVKAGDEYVAVFNKEFSNTVPYGITTFYYDSTKVRHMLFNKMVDYEAPFKTVKNADGEWIPFEFSLLLLNSSDVVLDKKIHVDMPEKNIVDIYMDVLKNNDRYLFDWEADAGATHGSMFAMGTAANMVQIFNGVLDWDGASWCQLINSFSMDSSSYDAKYSESFAKMFCTYSDEELSQDVDAMKEKLKPFDGGEWISDSMKDIDDLYDDKIGDLSRATADLKKKVVAENKASMIAFNKSYQELDELCSKTDTFNHLTNVLDDFYSIVEIAGYASEFQNQDKFAVKSLDTFIKNSNYGCVMSKAMKDGLRDYKNTLETDIVSYSAYNYLMNNMGDLLKEGLDVSTTLLDTESKIYLLIWDISKETVPWVKNGLSNTDCFLQSMYAGIVQSDTFKSYIDKRDAVFKDANNITSKNLYEVTQYCYTISFFSNYTPKKSKEDIDAGIYEKFIKNGEYNNYLTSDWEYGMPSQYAVLDIDGNGVDELIIYGNENEWGNIIVFTYKGDTQEIVPIQANLYDTGDTSRKTNVIWFCKNMEYSPQYHALAFTDSHYGVGNEDYLYYTINNDVFDIAFDVSAFTNYNTGDIRYSKGGINVERNDISESDYEAYINELKPIEWKKLP